MTKAKVKYPWHTEWTTKCNPYEYDWKDQFEKSINYANKNKLQVLEFDIGKIAGLCEYIDKLERENYTLSRDKGFKFICMNCGSSDTSYYTDEDFSSRCYCKTCGQSE